MAVDFDLDRGGIRTPRGLAVFHQFFAVLALVAGSLLSVGLGISGGADAVWPIVVTVAVTLSSAFTLYTISVAFNWLASYYALAARGFEAAPPEDAPTAEPVRR